MIRFRTCVCACLSATQPVHGVTSRVLALSRGVPGGALGSIACSLHEHGHGGRGRALPHGVVLTNLRMSAPRSSLHRTRTTHRNAARRRSTDINLAREQGEEAAGSGRVDSIRRSAHNGGGIRSSSPHPRGTIQQLRYRRPLRDNDSKQQQQQQQQHLHPDAIPSTEREEIKEQEQQEQQDAAAAARGDAAGATRRPGLPTAAAAAGEGGGEVKPTLGGAPPAPLLPLGGVGGGGGGSSRGGRIVSGPSLGLPPPHTRLAAAGGPAAALSSSRWVPACCPLAWNE